VFRQQNCPPDRCTKHKEEGQVATAERYCMTEGSTTQASFGIEGERLSCKKHMRDDYVRMRLKCACGKGAMYGIRGGKAISCARHREEGYVNLWRKPCNAEGCDKEATRGLAGGKRVSCKQHSAENYVCLRRKPCNVEGCDKEATCGLAGGKRVSCKRHSAENYVCLRSKRHRREKNQPQAQQSTGIVAGPDDGGDDSDDSDDSEPPMPAPLTPYAS
jgi:hypothetical protein